MFEGDEKKNANVNQLKLFDTEQATKNCKAMTQDFVEAVITKHLMQQGYPLIGREGSHV